MRKNKGITLIALVVTIVVILILASITIGTLMGENSTIRKAQEAKREQEISQEKEIVELSAVQAAEKDKFGNIEKDNLNQALIENIGDGKFTLTEDDTKFTIIFKDSSSKTEHYVWKDIPILTNNNIKITCNPSTWTNQNVTATVTTTIKGYTIQTSKSGKDWTSTNQQIYSENGTIYVRLINENGEYNRAITGNITNIDKTKPIIKTVTSTTNSIKITATDEASGIIGYTATTSNTVPSNFIKCTSTKSLSTTIPNLKQNTTYYVWVKDQAGNISVSKTIKTQKVPDLTTANVTFTYNPNTWTNQNVTVTANTTITGYTIETSQDNLKWSATNKQIRSSNGPVYVRLADSTGQVGGTATGNVTIIDKLAPNIFVPTVTETARSFIINGETTDKNATDKDGCSGIKRYYFSIEEDVWLPTGGQTEGSYTFKNLEYGKTYNIKMKAVDNAGNETITEGIPKQLTKQTVSYYIDKDNMKKEEYMFGESVLNPPFTPQKANWTFVGWKEDKTANGQVLTNKIMGDNEITLYAEYKKDIYFNYNGNGATSGSMGTQSVTSYYNASGNYANTTLTLRKNVFARVGYGFEGWSTVAGGPKIYSDEQIVSNLNAESQGTINLYTIWRPITYKITYNISKGAISGGYTKEFTIETETFNLPTPTGTNYVFKGWYENSNFSGAQISRIPKGTVGNKVVYAKEHQHTGQPGQSSPNGCYTKKEVYGGKCLGHRKEIATSYSCGWCGTVVSGNSPPSSCPNRVCGSVTGGQRWRVNSTKTWTDYCSSSNGCNNWQSQYRYILGCGW